VSNRYYAQGPGQRLAFQGWSGNATGTLLTSDPILMDGPKTAVAQYGTQFYLDVSSAYGTVSGADWYDQGATAHAIVASREVVVSPGTRELFVGWSGDAAGTDVTSNGIAMDRSKIATPVWHTQYSLTIQAGPGTATTAGWYDAGAAAVASLASGIVPGATGTRSVSVPWNGDASGTDPAGAIPIPMNGPRTAGTTWRTEYELRITSAYGSVVGAGWYQAGSPATASADASVTVTMTGPMTVRANWTTATALGGLSGTMLGLILLVLGIALVIGLLVASRRRRSE